jgi:acetyl-CoA synthetase
VEKEFLWAPTPESIRRTNLYPLMREQGAADYAAIHAWSVRQREAFWQRTIELLGIRFRTPYTRLLDLSGGVAHPRWLCGARINIAESCFGAAPQSAAIVTRRAGGKTETISLEQLDRLSNRVANGLRGMGIAPGDAVAIDMAMTSDAVAIYLGMVKSGAAVVSIPDSLPPDEIARRLRIAQAKAVFTQDLIIRGGKSLPMYEKLCEADAPPTVVLGTAVEPKIALRSGDIRWDDFLSADDGFEAVASEPEAVTNILFSSGTTGEPKAIPWDHTTPIKCAADAFYHHDIHPGDVVCWPTSLGWMMGPWLVYAALVNRASIALYEGAPTERGFCQFVQDVRVTMLGLVPSIVKSWRATSAANGLDWSGLRCYSSSGEASDPGDYGWLMRLNQPDGGSRPVIEYCGGTEIGGGYISSTLLVPHRPAEFNAKAMGIDFVVLNEEGAECAPGESGEVFLQPPSIGLSTRLLNADHDAVYYADCPVLDGQPLRRHGDQMIVVEAGRFCSNGRADDAMNLGGIKIGSVEIEQVLNQIDGVLETAAVAVPPAGGGPDRLVIFAVLKPETAKEAPLDALRQAMQEAVKRRLNPLFHIADVVAVESLPRTASNKMMRRVLRNRYAERE